MAVEDLTKTGLNNQKRGVSVAVMKGITEAQILTTGCIPFKLPENSLVTNVIVNVTTVSTTSNAVVKVEYGASGEELAVDIAVTAAGAIVGTIVAGKAYLALGGNITILSDGTAPAAGDLVCDLIVEYIELDKVTGEYTPYYEA